MNFFDKFKFRVHNHAVEHHLEQDSVSSHGLPWSFWNRERLFCAAVPSFTRTLSSHQQTAFMGELWNCFEFDKLFLKKYYFQFRRHRHNDVLIKGGEWRLGSDEEPKPFQIVRVQRILFHPQYQPKTLQNDIALLYLENDIKYDETHIMPICLDENEADPAPSDHCVTTGWSKEVLKGEFWWNFIWNCHKLTFRSLFYSSSSRQCANAARQCLSPPTSRLPITLRTNEARSIEFSRVRRDSVWRMPSRQRQRIGMCRSLRSLLAERRLLDRDRLRKSQSNCRIHAHRLTVDTRSAPKSIARRTILSWLGN